VKIKVITTEDERITNGRKLKKDKRKLKTDAFWKVRNCGLLLRK
jgi:hypothetical protein